MQGKHIVPMLAVCLATVIVVWATPGKPLAAGGSEPPPYADADGDFLPDGVEWTMLTSSADPDTDGDGQCDFLELLQNSDPRQKGQPLPEDYQMRLVLSGPSAASADPFVWLHVLLNLPGGKVSDISSFAIWLEVEVLPGLQVPLDMFAPLMVSRERDVAGGKWLQLSMPLVEPTLILAIGNCTFHARATVGGTVIDSGMQIVPAQGDLLAVVPIGDQGYFVFQSISPQLSVDGDAEPNRVCMLDLQEVGSGPGGTQYQIVDADCEDANELECASTCQDSIGWIITIPGGTGLLGGN